ncbi:hypothetical protein P8605_15895 [Streptomyces sp. T-3]|nr:hypothetical protein [Streptomyces sp. T-3]
MSEFLGAAFDASRAVNPTAPGCTGPCDNCDYPESKPVSGKRRVLRAVITGILFACSMTVAFLIAAAIVEW